jgi:2-amino-4-hydroxy-6-hydroxymethyldihydropteridine diphosphokinase
MILIALGANLPGPAGGPAQQIAAALAAIAGSGIRVLARSRLYRSPAWPPSEQPDYVNAVARLGNAPAPEPLLARLHAIEAALGRRRGVANAARAIDLDLLDYDAQRRDGPVPPLLPHPRLANRAFVLLPLAEIAPDWRHPIDGREIAALIARLPSDHCAEPLDPTTK